MTTPNLKQAIDFFRLKEQWLGEGGQPVPPEQSQARADVCLKCPHNQEKPIYELFAGSVARTVMKQLQLKSKMELKAKNEECLHVCDVCLCVLKLKVHAPLKFILENGVVDGLPDFCWQITEQKEGIK